MPLILAPGDYICWLRDKADAGGPCDLDARK
jgi:hypothetical protein